jgi:hypothetical protein
MSYLSILVRIYFNNAIGKIINCEFEFKINISHYYFKET